MYGREEHQLVYNVAINLDVKTVRGSTGQLGARLTILHSGIGLIILYETNNKQKYGTSCVFHYNNHYCSEAFYMEL